MSEQPLQHGYPEPHNEGTVFDDPNDYRIDLRAYNSVPKYDQAAVDHGRAMFEKSPIEEAPLSEAAVIGANLVKLCNVRDQYKLIEETNFFKNNTWDKAA